MQCKGVAYSGVPCMMHEKVKSLEGGRSTNKAKYGRAAIELCCVVQRRVMWCDVVKWDDVELSSLRGHAEGTCLFSSLCLRQGL